MKLFNSSLYSGFEYMLAMNDQPVAGFQGFRRISRNAVALADGLTYDRALLRWASEWHLAVPWLRYVLWWHRPARRLQIWQYRLDGQASLLENLQDCRVQRFQPGCLQRDGSLPVEIFHFSHR